ncbi:restriction endonuclease subunit S [Kitasatospora sp. NPDC059803]|uniref:restriction endonuclease subunit S n=1 Tax=Kitasatospora sp. NPDC059803 TaxID=3346953 RepID=UPI00365694F2
MTWPFVPLKRLVDPARPITYGIVQAGPDTPAGVPYIRPVDMSQDGGVTDVDSLLRTTPEIARTYRRSEVASGDVVVSIGPSFGKVMIVPAELSGANLTQGTARVASAAGISNRFLYWALQSSTARQFWDASVGGATFRALNLEPLGRTPLPLPPPQFQHQIAGFLDAEATRIDRIVELNKVLLDRLEERGRALRDAAVTRLIEQEGELPLRRFAARIEQGASPQCEAIAREDASEWAVLKLSAVKGGKFDPTENKRLPDDITPIRAHEVRRDDLLVTRANTPKLVGDVAVVSGYCKGLLIPDLIYRVGLLEGVNPRFIAEVALSGRVRSLIESTARGSSQSMVKLRGEDIKEWPIPRGDKSQQEELVRVIDEGSRASRGLHAAITRQLALLAERRQALITAAITGQFDVSTASGRGVTE